MEKKKTKEKRSTFFLLHVRVNTAVISETQTPISILNDFKTKRKLYAESRAIRRLHLGAGLTTLPTC